MLKGICPKCGQEYYGWALQDEEHRLCHQCGGKLHVTQEASVIKKRGKAHASILRPLASDD